MARTVLDRRIRERIATWRERVASLGSRIDPAAAVRGVRDARQRLGDIAASLNRERGRVLGGLRDRIGGIAARLEGVSPLATISRGFAIVSRHDGILVDRVDVVDGGDHVAIRVTDGVVEGIVRSTRRHGT